jgi:hypothetical protein
MWYGTACDAVGYAQFRAGTKAARIEIRDAGGQTVEIVDHDPNERRKISTIGGL